MKTKGHGCHSDKSQCPLAHALDIVGDKWTLLILREMLFFEKHEFREFLAAPEGISTNILSDRLKKLVDMKIIDSVTHPDDKKRKLYYPTEAGRALAKPMMEMIRWAYFHLPSVDIPPDKAEMVENAPDKAIEMALAILDEWETKYLEKNG